MSQNSLRYSWTFEEVDNKLKDIMKNIFEDAKRTAEEYGRPGDLVAGSNIVSFVKVANILLANGLV